MKVSKEEILHIAKLADLEIKDEEIEKYALNLQDILDFAEVVNNAPVDGLDVTVGANEKKNVFRKDEIKIFEVMKHYCKMHHQRNNICLRYQKS